MKKIAILTIVDNNNYGNRLQNYALQEKLKEYGCRVETIINQTDIVKQGADVKTIAQRVKLVLALPKKVGKKLYIAKRSKTRSDHFSKFNKAYLTFAKETITIDTLPKELANHYDYFIIGSDQVWNPTYTRLSDIDFGGFSPKEKVISYAPSIGIDFIPEERKEIFKKGLANISFLSIREEKGKELIQELTGLEAQVVLDPTMLLTKEQWDQIVEKPKKVPKAKYLLVFLLGKISKERRKLIQQVATRYQLEIVTIGNVLQKDYYIAGPSEFVYYISHAALVLTDSFHGSVLSFLYGKSFYALDRNGGNHPSMNSRLDTLLRTLKLQDRRMSEIEVSKITLNQDYQDSNAVWEKERKRSEDFIKKALKI